jgi:hypothetical protein
LRQNGPLPEVLAKMRVPDQLRSSVVLVLRWR